MKKLNMYGFYEMIFNLFEIGSNKSDPGVIYLTVNTKNEFVWTVKNMTPGAVLFEPRFIF